jgi:imidazolonepropionase-like amidohydrolase
MAVIAAWPWTRIIRTKDLLVSINPERKLLPRRATLAACAALLSIGMQAAESQASDAEAQSVPLVIRAAHIFDGVSGTLLTGGALVVQGERIVSVSADAKAPAAARVIDLGDATLLPGFIDAHTHIAWEAQTNFQAGLYKDMLRFPAEQAHYAAAYAKKTLEAGFTTIRNVGNDEFLDVGLRNAINAGIAVGPRILSANHLIGSTGGHCDSPPFPPDRVERKGLIEGICNGADQCREAVRNQLKWGADVIKICTSGGVLSEADPVDVPQFTPAELEAMVSEAHAWKRKVAAHAHGDLAARLAVEAGVDSIEHGSFLSEDTLRLMKRKGTYLVPTRVAVYWVFKQVDTLPPQIAAKVRAVATAHADMFRMAMKVGVPIALGSDAGVVPHGMNALEFRLMKELGMAPAAALLAGTRDAAKLLGVDSEVGTLEAGKWADIVAVPGNVLNNIEATEHPLLVMKHGRVVMQRPAT